MNSFPRCRACRGQSIDGESCLQCGRPISDDVQEAEARLLAGVRNALLIELVLFSGVLAGLCLPLVWPAP